MNAARIRWLALGAALIVLAFGYASLSRTVTVMADGQVVILTTRAVTVGGALRDAGIMLGSGDQTTPNELWPISDGTVIDVQRAARIQLHVDGQVYQTQSGERNPAVLLALWNIDLGEGDRLTLAGQTVSLGDPLPDEPFISLEVRRAVELAVNEGGRSTSFLTSAPTVGQALAEHGIQLSVADDADPAAETPLDDALTVTILRARPITIEIDDESIEAYSASATVGEALTDAGIALQGLDYSEPAADQALPDDGHIAIVRVSESLVLEQEILPHATEFQVDPEAELGASSVIQEGQDGVTSSRTRVRYENGVEVSQIQEDGRVLVEPITQINGYGSQAVIRTTVVDGVEIEYWATMSMYATSYSPCRSGVDQCLYGTSTSGVSVAKGVVATYRDWLLAARGVTIYVPGYGPGAFYDVGGGFPDGRPWIDLGYSDSDWVGWSGWVTVYFTTPVPANIPYFIYP